MIRLFINGVAASAGGGLTYLRNVIPEISRRPDTHVVALLPAALRREFADLPNVSFIETGPLGSLRRMYWEQTTLPRLIRRNGAQVLISTGNIALWNSPVPQILLSRNSLYTSDDFLRDLQVRGDYTLWLDTWVKGWIAKQSITWTDVAVAPSAAFAAELTEWSGKKAIAIHHGFDADAFTSNATPLPADVQTQLDAGADALRLLFVSHYNYYRNFETLFRAMPLLQHHLKEKKVKLYLTCRLGPDANPGSYKTRIASSLLEDLRRSCDIVELGSIPYHSLHHLYRACHIYVTPAYTETFAHPLVESMSSGLPVVASDLPVHREICSNAAVYFSRFSSEELANAVLQVHEDREVAAKLQQAGLERAKDFSWKNHVESVLALARELVARQR
jgi:glycosyltransferase involved in cell wall biosynthesis